MLPLLPVSLFALVQSFLLLVDAQQQLALDTVAEFNSSALPSPPTFRLPASADLHYVSVAFCASSSSPPQFFVTNDTSISQPGSSDVDNISTFQITIGDEGFGSWAGIFPNGGILAVDAESTNTPFEVLVSATNATNQTQYLLVGDTTANQALIFSPPFDAPSVDQPSYPNYTLPTANLTQPSPPSNPTNYSLVFVPTSSSSLTSLPRTECAIRAAAQQASSGVTILSRSQSDNLWLRDANGWRWEWFLSGLTPRTNYTAYALQDGQLAASKPVMFVTKSASFECPLVHSLPYCPTISYAIPLPPLGRPDSAYTASTLPSEIGHTIISGVANLTTALTTLACGRDKYSYLVGCDDCQAAYRTWLCTVSFPRCGEDTSSSTTTSSSAATTTTSRGLFGGNAGDSAQQPVAALQTVAAGAESRNPAFPASSRSYSALLPCLEVCNAADRVCPIFLGFQCPLPQFTAASSYGVGYIDSGEDGVVGGGATGAGQDVWGNVWCNGA